MRKPIILISGEDGIDAGGGANFVIRKAYVDAVEKAGGIPVVALDVRTAAVYASQTDALILTDGPNLHPSRYGEIIQDFKDLKNYSRTRDELDFHLLAEFVKAGKPVLGIGRGAAVINAFRGGTVGYYKDDENPKANLQTINIKAGSFLKKIYGSKSLQNRFQKFSINKLGKGLKKSAVSQGGEIEAIEDNKDHIYAVLFNPEKELGEVKTGNEIFEFFIEKALEVAG